ncbi:1-deoxy-D-xylulose-5-phosphate synthase [Streptomyces yerevanensis]|uniref:1-deoxy-D-xylulose-5-phosphate synthase n=1 Tax=Streptomyces yerevanensis TaxID=66378 RepID=UPI00068CFF7E|nr:1-deoxy-D-xylulose-5-phosphate synthase [Streptomyces yerevanensis]
MALPSVTPDIPRPGLLRECGSSELTQLAGHIRAFLIDKVTAAGGHLGPNLGVVELTIALHRVFDTPRDTLLFDTGHQSYVHKILTGRRDGFDRLRRCGGLSGYPSRAESPHDHIENSHASTALAYADGLAKARALSGEGHRSVVAVVGDGALTGGLALEALNNIGASPHRPVVVVLNDNGRSYSPTVGALALHLRGLRHAPQSADGGPRTCGPPDHQNFFENLGFLYLGPVDGHDITALEAALGRARTADRPVVVHTVTVKGKGYEPAEADEDDRLHTVGAADPATTAPRTSPAPSWTDVFATELITLAAGREDLVGITAAMPGPTGLARLAAVSPDRVFDVGIAEQHAVTSAAGLAMGGYHPVVALYATFLNRAFDQVLMDVALHRLPVTFVLDRAGITGPDGASHHGMWDLSVLSAVPGLRVGVPRDAPTLRVLLREALDHGDGPTAIRFPKAAAGADIPAVDRGGTGRGSAVDTLACPGVRDVLIVAVGPLATDCLSAAAYLTAQGVGTGVIDPRWVLPVSPEVVRLAAMHRLVVTVEDNTRAAGVGTAVAQACHDAGVRTPVVNLGLPHAFVSHGTRPELLKAAGLHTHGIVHSVLRARAGRPLDTTSSPLWSA